MKIAKATKSQTRNHNRQLVLRTLYMGAATNRAALAQETGLAKPTISDLVAELMAEGYLAEEGLGESTDSGGKRPRLLHFLPEARQVIGISISQTYILGALTNLNGEIIVEHQAELASTEQTEVLNTLVAVINGLIAQMSAPLLCLSVGISAVVDEDSGVVRHAPRFGWHDVPLASVLGDHFGETVYVSNSTELAARALFALQYGESVASLATVLISNSVGFGFLFSDGTYASGNDIGHLLAQSAPNDTRTIEDALGWHGVLARARILANQYDSPYLRHDALSYMHIRHAVYQGDPAACALQDELSAHVAQVIAWVITLMRPEHISLAGMIAHLGDDFLQQVVEKARLLVVPELVARTGFSIDDTTNLVSIGAAAKAIQTELGVL